MEMTIGERIAAHRKKLGLTQDKLAELLGVTAQAISKWENNQSCPDITMLPKLAELFRTTTDALLGIETEAPPVVEPQPIPEDTNPDQKSGIHLEWNIRNLDGIAMAVFVLLVGALTFLSRFNGWGVSFWSILWPSAILVFGLRSFFERISFFSAGCSLVGLYFLLDNLNVFWVRFDGDLVFPIVILIFGCALLFDALKKPKSTKRHIGSNKTENKFSTDGETFHCSLTFGEAQRTITMPKLSYGDISCTFGSSIVDLSGCEEFSENCSICAKCSFGELIIRVPKCLQAETNGSTAFGNMDVHGQPDSVPAGTIYINGKVGFGEIAIEYV